MKLQIDIITSDKDKIFGSEKQHPKGNGIVKIVSLTAN